MQAKREKSTMTDLYAAQSIALSRPSLPFLEAFLLRKATYTPMLTGKHFEYPSLVRIESLLDGFLCCVRFVVDRENKSFCLLTSMVLTCTKLQLIVFAF